MTSHPITLEESKKLILALIEERNCMYAPFGAVGVTGAFRPKDWKKYENEKRMLARKCHTLGYLVYQERVHWTRKEHEKISRYRRAKNLMSYGKKSKTVPWCEKYRPATFHDFAGLLHTKIVNSIHFINEHLTENPIMQLPHFLFYGPPGSGKNTMIHIFFTYIASLVDLPHLDYKKTFVTCLNAAQDRGISTIRHTIKKLAQQPFLTLKIKKKKIEKEKKKEEEQNDNDIHSDLLIQIPRFIVLDEADKLTGDAQFALRAILEEYMKNCRFMFVLNDINAFIPALQSRTCKIFFSPLSFASITKKLTDILSNEKKKKKRKNQQIKNNNKNVNQLQIIQGEGDKTKSKLQSELEQPEPLTMMEPEKITTITATILEEKEEQQWNHGQARDTINQEESHSYLSDNDLLSKEEKECISIIATQSNGDLRSAINNLQLMFSMQSQLTPELMFFLNRNITDEDWKHFISIQNIDQAHLISQHFFHQCLDLSALMKKCVKYLLEKDEFQQESSRNNNNNNNNNQIHMIDLRIFWIICEIESDLNHQKPVEFLYSYFCIQFCSALHRQPLILKK